MRSINIYDVTPCLGKREWLTWVALVQSLPQMQQAAGCDYGHLKTGLVPVPCRVLGEAPYHAGISTGWVSILTTWLLPSLRLRDERERRRTMTLMNSVSEVSGCPFRHILSCRSESLSSTNPQGNGN